MRYEITDGMTRWKCFRDWSRCSHYYVGRLRACLMFQEKEIHDDVQRNAVVQGRPLQKESRDGNKSVAQTVAFQEVGEQDNWEWCRRVLGLAISDVENVLYVSAKSRMTEDRSEDDRKERETEEGVHNVETSEYAIELHVPDNFSDTTVTKILRVTHDYIVCRILWEWANMTCPQFAEFWEKKMTADLEDLKIESKRIGVLDNSHLQQSWI